MMILTIAIWSLAGFSNESQVVKFKTNINQDNVTVLTIDKDSKAKIKVNGNCGMCKTRIEKAALEVKGVSKAEWNKETHELALTFNENKTNVETVQKAIAKVGHDTGKFKADDKVYNALPGCCKYDRGDK